MLRCAETQSWSQQAKYPLFNAQTVQVCLGHLLRHSTQELAVKATFCFPSLHRGQGSTHESSTSPLPPSHIFFFSYFCKLGNLQRSTTLWQHFSKFCSRGYVCVCKYIYILLNWPFGYLCRKKMNNIFLTCRIIGRINHLKASFICYFYMIT